jgi:hypothetical protein
MPVADCGFAKLFTIGNRKLEIEINHVSPGATNEP